jgi:excinuclease ABC subunit C
MTAGHKDDLKKDLALVPERPGVYMFKNGSGAVIYVGKAVSLPNRLRSYFRLSGHSERIERMVQEAVRFDYIVVDSEVEALILECNLIKEYRPKYNINLKDDKSYPYLRVTADEYPRVLVTRRLYRDGSRYFGPYPNVGAVKETAALLRKLFSYRTCKDQKLVPRGRPCLDGQIKLCLGPCAEGATRQEYREMIEQLMLFMEGKTQEIEKQLQNQMNAVAKDLDFEQAAHLRNQLAAIRKVQEQQRVTRASGPDQDVLALGSFFDEVCVLLLRVRGGKVVEEEHYFLAETEDSNEAEMLESFIKQYYHAGRDIPATLLVSAALGEADLLGAWLTSLRHSKVVVRHPQRGRGRELMKMARENADLNAEQKHRRALRSQEKGRSMALELQKALELEHFPKRLECIDISHFAGTETVGSLVCFTDGQPDRSGYRRYKIQTAAPGDDYAAIHEVVTRRVSSKKDPLPDLLVIDGGKGQLHSALSALEEAVHSEVPVISLAKEEEDVFIPGRLYSVRLARRHPGLHLLQQARDEAHRFGNSYREKLQLRKLQESEINQVPGIGKKRQAALLKHFGSLSRLRQAGVDVLAAAPGMNRKAAQALYSFLQKEGR